MITIEKIKSIIEALLVVSEGGLTNEDFKRAIPDADAKDIMEAIDLLREDYEGPERAFNIAEIAGRYRVVTKPEYMPWISNLYQKEPDRLKGASLETLAIVAYKQPATRGEIEAVRGVNVGGVIRTLLDKGLLEVRGRKDVIGKPLLYGTTEKFLELFGLNSLSDLPSLREFSEEDLDFGKAGEQLPLEDEAEEGADVSSQASGLSEEQEQNREGSEEEAPEISNEEQAGENEDTIGGELRRSEEREELDGIKKEPVAAEVSEENAGIEGSSENAESLDEEVSDISNEETEPGTEEPEYESEKSE